MTDTANSEGLKKLSNTFSIEKKLESFKGFASPTTTATPDEIFDRFLTELTHAELKVVLYIVRRTFGFKKKSDSISMKQICDGIKTKSGKELDKGAGVDRRTAQRAIKSLEERGLVTVRRVQTEDGYNYVNVYSLRFRDK
jgi:DNA-binding MarR family transcriptional regulator